MRFEGQVGPLWGCYPWNMQCSGPGLRFGGDGRHLIFFLNLENIMQKQGMGQIKVQL